MVSSALESRKACPITPLRIEVSVGWRIDFLAPGGDLSEAPITLPAIPLSNQRSVFGGGGNRTNTICAAITGTASPLPVKNLDRVLVRQVLSICDAKASDLFEPVVARPALLGRAVMRRRRDVGMELLGVPQAR